MVTYGIDNVDGTYGQKLFYESRGYTVPVCYNQKTDNTIAGGFSFAQFKAEIDAGRPVFLNLAGHSVVGIGYNDTGSTVYIHDTWDYLNHSMTWGGSYAGMQLLSVSIVNLNPPGGTALPTAPSGLTATASSTAQINLSWSDNSSNETGFYIERKTGTGTYAQIGSVSAGVTSYSSSGLSPGTTYTFRVRAYNSSGNSAYSNEASATTSGTALPAAPSGLTATAASASQINLSWSDNSSNETGFYIERKVGSTGTYVQLSPVSAGVKSYSDTGLKASTTYYYRVRAYNSGGTSAYSNVANATTKRK